MRIESRASASRGSWELKVGRVLVLMIISLFFVMGCAGSRSGGSSGVSPVQRLTPPDIKRVELSITRDQLLTALEQDVLTDRLRVVQTFSSQESGNVPLYRLFDVHPKSIYGILGLKNADILVAANERYLRNSLVFKQFVRMLRGESTAMIEVVRGVEPILFSYKFEQKPLDKTAPMDKSAPIDKTAVESRKD
jgi:hypothetical protein